MRHTRELQSDTGQQRLKDCHTDHALRHRAYRKPGQRNKILIALRHDPRLDPSDCVDQAEVHK